jgi:chromosome segregation ATPase
MLMADANGVWFEPATGADRVVATAEASGGLESELTLLETRVAEAADLVLRLREELATLARERETLLLECEQRRRECESLRRDHDALRREREETGVRLSQIIAKVDALRGEP